MHGLLHRLQMSDGRKAVFTVSMPTPQKTELNYRQLLSRGGRLLHADDAIEMEVSTSSRTDFGSMMWSSDEHRSLIHDLASQGPNYMVLGYREGDLDKCVKQMATAVKEINRKAKKARKKAAEMEEEEEEEREEEEEDGVPSKAAKGPEKGLEASADPLGLGSGSRGGAGPSGTPETTPVITRSKSHAAGGGLGSAPPPRPPKLDLHRGRRRKRRAGQSRQQEGEEEDEEDGGSEEEEGGERSSWTNLLRAKDDGPQGTIQRAGQVLDGDRPYVAKDALSLRRIFKNCGLAMINLEVRREG